MSKLARFGTLDDISYDAMDHHPFADLIDLKIQEQRPGASVLTLVVGPDHLNPHQVAHGAVLFALADTGMGAALYPALSPGEICATIEIKINYFKPVRGGQIRCETETLNKGKSVANLQSRLLLDGQLVAVANGNYAIFKPTTAQPSTG